MILTFLFTGGAEGARTPDLMTASHALSQLSYSPNYEKENFNKCQLWCQYIFCSKFVCQRPATFTITDSHWVLASGKLLTNVRLENNINLIPIQSSAAKRSFITDPITHIRLS